MSLGDGRLLRMQRAAEVAARVLAELWPEGCAVLVEQVAESMYFEVEMESDGITIRRVADVRDSLLYDEISLGDQRPRLLPRGARQLESGPEVTPGRVGVDIRIGTVVPPLAVLQHPRCRYNTRRGADAPEVWDTRLAQRESGPHSPGGHLHARACRAGAAVAPLA